MRKITCFLFTAAFTLFCSSGFTQSFDIFIKVLDNNGVIVDGGSTVAGHLKEFQTFSESFGVSNSCSTCVDISSYNIMTKLVGGTISLYQLSLTDLHMQSVDVTFHRSANTFDFYKVHMEDVIVESVQESGATGGDDTPTVSISFHPTRIAWQFTATKSDGVSGGTKTKGGWDNFNKIQWSYY